MEISIPENRHEIAVILWQLPKMGKIRAELDRWFSEFHYWLSDPAKRGVTHIGYGAAPSMIGYSKFSIVFAAIVLFFGLLVPMGSQPEQAGWTLGLFIAVLVTTSLMYFIPLVLLRIIWLFGASFIIVDVAKQLNPEAAGSNMLLGWFSGAILGYMLAAHLVYRRCRKAVETYSPFACLWVRHHPDKQFELVLTDVDHTFVWRRVTKHPLWLYERYLGDEVAIALFGEARLRQASLGDQPGPWVRCYPGLVAPKSVRGRLVHPRSYSQILDLGQSIVTDEELRTFVKHLPPYSDEPPGYQWAVTHPNYTVAANAPW